MKPGDLVTPKWSLAFNSEVDGHVIIISPGEPILYLGLGAIVSYDYGTFQGYHSIDNMQNHVMLYGDRVVTCNRFVDEPISRSFDLVQEC